ncbi:hypothetical protein JD844_012822 [Phrynosoma platyrhinos]|uniref:Cadherin EGF LAG seven-pass G-type receptor 3 n=1 Tax=Phrynosoma platyrhinos TaxID=52577 RepID=A0ABQ7TKI2_PHRPL|nr:hypothetical protein JD844_012822 [Phrynosoma platyrhinos]
MFASHQDLSPPTTISYGIHSVTAQCVLRVIIITEDMLANSITVRLENMWQERFLSPLLANFLEGVATVLATPKEDVFIFNIQNDTDVGGQVLNVSFSAMAPRSGHFFSSEELQEQLYMKRMTLTSVSMLEVLPFDDNVCLREPCQNYMKCISILKFDSSAPFIASLSTLFRPIHPITGLRCRCPQGFTGDYCEMEINLCYSNPCHNGGVCTRKEGGYTCICRQHFTGDNCEVDSRAGRCVPGVCRNGGTCTNLADGGFQCQCPPGGFEKPYCEVSTRSFPPKSFIMFRGLRQRFHLTLSLSFATLEHGGLLIYNGRLNEKHDFLAVEIVDEQVQLKYSTGESSTIVTPYVPGGVSDGQWHTLQLHYYNKPKISSLGSVQGPSKEKVAILIVDQCDASVALQFGSEIGNYTCAAEGVQSSSKKSLDLTGPLLLGGVPNLPENFPVEHREFVGCMRDLYIDNKRIDLASYIANNGTSTAMHHPHNFHGNSILFWDFKNEMKISTPWYMGLAFRTRQLNGVLLQAHAGQYITIRCQLDSGLLSFMVNRSSGRTTKLLLDQMQLNDGAWHDLQLQLQDRRSGQDARYIITLNLDFGSYQDTVVVGNELHGLKVKHLHVGGILESGKVHHGFTGCIQGVRLGDTATGTALPKPSSTLNVEAGCTVPNPCDSNPCPANSICQDQWQSYSCVCQPGYYGGTCVDACHLNPCKNKSACRRKPAAPHGYVFIQQMDQQCPKGWWGNPTCGPCNCEAAKGFDPDCNKTNGQCHCKEFHYHPKGSDACFPCDCYPVGSSSRSCDQETGQCHCRPGVIGRQCNSCDSPFAEVTSSGCQVLYDACPKSLKAGVWWPQTKFGLPAVVPCPKGSLGLRGSGAAVRQCNEERGWLEPDLFNCTSPAFKELSALLEGLERNETELNTIEAKKLAHQLRAVTDQMERYFGNDVHITYRLLSHLMAFESRQHGFGLTATQDAHFNENLLQAGSSVLTLENHEHWDTLLQNGHGSAGLMEQLRKYTSTLASNMKLTYLNPVGVVTPNIVLSIDRMENHTHFRRRYPRYHSSLFRGQSMWDPHTHVVLPLSVLTPHKVEAPTMAAPVPANSETNDTVESSPPNHSLPETEPAVTILILIIYRTLGGLLPARYQVDRRNLRLPKNPVMNSPIVSVSLFSNHTFLQSTLEMPLVLEFRLLETDNRSKPLCVQWNSSSQLEPTGFWTARDCDLVYRNTTYVRCHCSQFGTFGVLMDSSHREQLEGDLETLAIVTYSLVSFSLLCLLLTFSFLICLKGLKSNTRGIHCNISVTLFFSELIFLVGINRTENQFFCTVIAILLHYFFLSNFAWLFVQGLHIYRMQTEARNINYGAMSMTLRSSFVLLLIISTAWVFGLLAVNNSVLAFHYLYTILCSLQGPNAYNNTALFEESGLIRITLGASTISSVSSVRSARTHSSQRGYLRDNMMAHQGSALDHSLLNHAGPTDLDVAMFHRDAGPDVDGNDLMSYWPVLGECEVHPCSLQKWGSERKLGFDVNKDAANNNQPDLALTSGDENSLTQSHRQRKGILKNRLQYPPALQGLSSVGRMTNDLSWYKTSTLGHRAVPAASYGRIYSGAGSLSQPASRYSSREQLDMLMRRQMSREQLSRNDSGECLEVGGSRHGSREQLDTILNRPRSREHLDTILSRHGSREHLASISSRHGSTENLGEISTGHNQRNHRNTLPRRQGSRDHLDTLPCRFGSREHLDSGGAVREISREWLNTVPSRQSSRDHMDTLLNRDTSREQLDLLFRRQPSRDQLTSARQTSREQLDFFSRRSNSREHLDIMPSRQAPRENLEPLSRQQPSRENLELLSRRSPSRENLEAVPSRHPSTEQLDILSSILASFNSSVLSSVQSSSTPSGPQTTPSVAQMSSTPSMPSMPYPSPPRSATSHSISELSPDSE